MKYLQNDSEMVSLGQLETMLKEVEKDKDKHGDIERISELLKVSLLLCIYYIMVINACNLILGQHTTQQDYHGRHQ